MQPEPEPSRPCSINKNPGPPTSQAETSLIYPAASSQQRFKGANDEMQQMRYYPACPPYTYVYVCTSTSISYIPQGVARIFACHVRSTANDFFIDFNFIQASWLAFYTDSLTTSISSRCKKEQEMKKGRNEKKRQGKTFI